jgi:hypothetical protein
MSTSRPPNGERPDLTHVATAFVRWSAATPSRCASCRACRRCGCENVANELRDLVRVPGLAATSVRRGRYTEPAAPNALVESRARTAGVPVAHGALTAAVTFSGVHRMVPARLAPAHRHTDLFAVRARPARCTRSLWPGARSPRRPAEPRFALGIAPVILADLMNRRIHVSERRATLLSFESLFQRGLYGVIVIPAAAALGDRSLSTVLIGFALLCVVPLALATRLRGADDAR